MPTERLERRLTAILAADIAGYSRLMGNDEEGTLAQLDDIFGDGVNVAARLEGLAEPGGICVSGRVQEDAQGKLDIAFEDIGEQKLKNIARALRLYKAACAAQWLVLLSLVLIWQG